MRIGVVIGRIGGIDGVALETEKWLDILREEGHRIAVLTGALEGPLADAIDVTVVDGLAFDHSNAMHAQQAVFLNPTGRDGDALLAALNDQADALAAEITRWITTQSVEALLIENASALPMHLQLGMAVRRVCLSTAIPTVTHDHDFAWERGDRYDTPYPAIAGVVAQCFPLVLPNVRHAVINQAAQSALSANYGVAAAVVPNVMDFSLPFARQDDYNATLCSDLGLADDAITLFQITRIVRRKGIETAIDLVHALGDPRVHLVITGTAVDDYHNTYVEELAARAHTLEVRDRIPFAGARFDNHPGTTASGHKIYSLSDAYARATACTYFSTYEGFGNAFVEAVLARRPIFVNNYKPVYWPDIGSKGFETVMVEEGVLTPEAVRAAQKVLVDPAEQTRQAATNYALGEAHFSYDAIRETLDALFGSPRNCQGTAAVVTES